jgi:hypothetical protein
LVAAPQTSFANLLLPPLAPPGLRCRASPTSAYPAPPDIAVQIFNRATILTMWAKLHSGQSIPQVIAWAKDEVQGFIR